MYYETRRGLIKAVDDISLSLDKGTALGVVGESGCGKSSLAFSILRLLPPNGKIIGGKILLDGVDILRLSRDEMNEIRLKRISIIFQSAMNSLNPVFRVGDQLIGALRKHIDVSVKEAKERVTELFELVGIPSSRMSSFPHELSGGMKQRALIAMSLLCNPDLIIADEATTALDTIVQDKILAEMRNLQIKFNLSLMIITHDMSVIAETCDKIAVMYAGKIVEYGDRNAIFHNPRHPYTIALIHSFPNIQGPLKKLTGLPGSPPNLLNLPQGCRFHPRCPIAKEEICTKKVPPRFDLNKRHYSYCHFASDTRLSEIRFELGYSA